MKQKLKEGDVVMILPHEWKSTAKRIGEIGLVANIILSPTVGYIYVVKFSHDPLDWNYLFTNQLFKIGTL